MIHYSFKNTLRSCWQNILLRWTTELKIAAELEIILIIPDPAFLILTNFIKLSDMCATYLNDVLCVANDGHIHLRRPIENPFNANV